MAIAMTLEQYLSDHDIDYDVLTHKATQSSLETAQASHVSGGSVAKGVVLKTGDGYLLAVLPASRHISIRDLSERFDQRIEFASEAEIEAIFSDCVPGAVPPVGPAYGLDTIIDDSIDDLQDVFLEGGDHMTLVHLKFDEFMRAIGDAPHTRFADVG